MDDCAFSLGDLCFIEKISKVIVLVTFIITVLIFISIHFYITHYNKACMQNHSLDLEKFNGKSDIKSNRVFICMMLLVTIIIICICFIIL